MDGARTGSPGLLQRFHDHRPRNGLRRGQVFRRCGQRLPAEQRIFGSARGLGPGQHRQLWARPYTFGVNQPAACNGYVYLPTGEHSSGTAWEVISESSGAVLGTIQGPTAGPHNTICQKDSSGNFHVYLGAVVTAAAPGAVRRAGIWDRSFAMAHRAPPASTSGLVSGPAACVPSPSDERCHAPG